MTSYTQGQLTYTTKKIEDGYEFSIESENLVLGKLYGSTNPMWDFVPGAREGEQNARHLVECWNACEWKPIETAPKDGTHILAWDGDVQTTVKWSPGLDAWTLCVSEGYYDLSGVDVTRWKPLGPPPK